MELTYTNVNGYLIPNLTYKSGEQMEQLGKYGFLRRDGIDSVRSAIKELEHHGYVERHRLRNEYGFYGDTEYIIREVPLGEEND